MKGKPRTTEDHRIRRLQNSIAVLSRSLQQQPAVQGFLERAHAYRQLGQWQNAEHDFRRVLVLESTNVPAYVGLAQMLEARGHPQEALAVLQRALEVSPDSPFIRFNLANSLCRASCYEEAVGHYQFLIEQRPLEAGVYNNCALALQELRRHDDAERCYRQGLTVLPGDGPLSYNLARLLQDNARFSEAVSYYEAAAKHSALKVQACTNLGNLLVDMGRPDQAERCYRSALCCSPGDGIAASALLLSLNYRVDLTPAAIFAEHRRWSSTRMPPETGRRRRTHPSGRPPKLRVGYLSQEFRQHSVACFLEPLLRQHDKSRFMIFGYSDTRESDAVTDRMRRCCDHWIDVVALSDAQICQRIIDHRIDILIDVSGHTGKRLGVFASRPAPVQVSYLGYPNTTGLATMDYRITDQWADPPGSEQFYTEKLIRLPTGFLCYQSDCPLVTPGNATLPAGERITLASFNNAAKINDAVIAVWSQILHELGQAKLVLKYHLFADRRCCEWFAERFSAAGISADRLDFRGWAPNRRAHLEQYRDVDIALDTFPYNGATTTCEALWQNVPVLTVVGDRHAARVGHSILQSANMTELIATDKSDYVAKVVRLVREKGRLSAVRQDLADRLPRAPLCDPQTFTRHFEQALERAWYDKARKQPTPPPADADEAGERRHDATGCGNSV